MAAKKKKKAAKRKAAKGRSARSKLSPAQSARRAALAQSRKTKEYISAMPFHASSQQIDKMVKLNDRYVELAQKWQQAVRDEEAAGRGRSARR